MTAESTLPPVSIVIFGAAGDLTWRKLVPSLYDLFLDNQLPKHFAIFGVDGKTISADEWREHLHDGIQQFSRHGEGNHDKWKAFAAMLVDYIVGDFSKPATFDSLA